MTRLYSLLTGTLAHTTFEGLEGPSYDADSLSRTLNAAYWGSPEFRSARSALPVVSGGWDLAVANHLRVLLHEYIDVDSDLIGHSFEVSGQSDGLNISRNDQIWHQGVSTVAGFALSLIRASAVLGPERVVDLVDGWSRGEPVRFKHVVLLGGGICPSEEVALRNGLRIYPLPYASNGFPLAIPESTSLPVHSLFGQALLELGTETSPALHLPDERWARQPEALTSTSLDSIPLETFFLALSLVSMRRVGMDRAWTDYGEVSSLRAGLSSFVLVPGDIRATARYGSISQSHATGITTLSVYERPEPNLTSGSLERGWQFLVELHKRVSSEPRFRVSVNRWAKSVAEDADDIDRAIDLRIALEALYLDSETGELGFRLATTCARHLGGTLEDRKEIWTAVRDFYNEASRVVHGTGTSSVPGLQRATELCRDGILKVLESGERPVWKDLLLSS